MGEKMRWIGELVGLATREGREDALVEEFERRKRASPQEVMPLLALAAIYRGLDDPRGQQEALNDAVRRRPQDARLVEELAAVAERNGDLGSALAWRKEAVRLQPGVKTTQRLADFHFRAGDVERGLAVLTANGDGAIDPRGLEKTLQTLVINKEWEILINYLTTINEVVAGDWRLSYFRAMALMEVGRLEEAENLFFSLLQVEKELPGVQPLMALDQLTSDDEGLSEVIESQWDYYGRSAFEHSGEFIPLNMPGEVRELRWLVLMHLIEICGEEDELLQDRLKTIGWDEGLFALLDDIDTPVLIAYFNEALAERPDDKRLLAYAVDCVGWSDELEKRWLTKAVEELDGQWKGAGQEARNYLVLRKSEESDNQVAALLGMLDEVE